MQYNFLKESLHSYSMAYHAFFSFVLWIILSIVVSFSAEEVRISFTAELIHRDSQISPFFNASETTSQRLNNALHRSSDRVNRINTLFRSGAKAFQAPLVYDNDGDYLMKARIGSPPTEILMKVDFVGDLTWIPCWSSRKCTTENCNSRVFDPTKSSTYRNLPCDSFRCQKTKGASCEFPDCFFAGDHAGKLATDIFTFSSTSEQPFSLPSTFFICGDRIDSDNPEFGFVSLGHGSLSFISRIYHLIDGKFSFCLVPYSSNQPSKLNFGSKGVVSGNGMVSTPLQLLSSKYSIHLSGIAVGDVHVYRNNQYLGYTLYLDSGAMFTHLPYDLYYKVEDQVKSAILQEPLPSDGTQKLSLCYQYTHDFNPPTIAMLFDGGNLQLSTWNSFIRMADNIVCLAFVSSRGDGLFGSWQQMNFLVGFDLSNGNGIVSFKKTDCTQNV